jgi:hypothetical protein
MRYLKRFNENKDVFMEYLLEFTEDGKPEELYNTRLSKILRFVKMQSIKDYTISGKTSTGEWKLVLKIGK